MNKQTAIDLLGGTPKKAAAALGYKSAHGVYVWPDPVPQALADRITGLLARTKKPRKAKVAA